MKEPEFDRDGYPTEATEQAIKRWHWDDCAGCLDFVKRAWYYPDRATHTLTASEIEILDADPSDKYLRLSTGGWSGNEDLICALDANRMIRALCWQMEVRGGLHIYKYPEAPR